VAAARDLFLSYNSRDRADVQAVYDALRAHGITAFFDRDALTSCFISLLRLLPNPAIRRQDQYAVSRTPKHEGLAHAACAFGTHVRELRAAVRAEDSPS
jgi:hypothetical protein